MRIESKKGLWVLYGDPEENLWEMQLNRTTQPKLKPELIEWLDHQIPGEWTTYNLAKTFVLVTRNKSALLLFKLTWQGSPLLYNPINAVGGFYCPYIPLVVTSIYDENDLGSPMSDSRQDHEAE